MANATNCDPFAGEIAEPDSNVEFNYREQFDIKDIAKINSCWDFTKHFHEVHRNDEFQSGYEDVIDLSTWEYQENPTNNSNFWGMLKTGFEPAAQDIYERIANFNQNIRDIEYCTIDALKSLASELDVSLSNYIEYDFPKDIRNLLDIMSVNRTLLLHEGKMIKPESLTKIIEIVGELPDIATELNSGFMVGHDTCPLEYSVLDVDDLTDFIDCVFEAQIKHILTLTGNPDSNGVSPSLLVLLQTQETEDSAEINELKISYNIPLSFNVKSIVSNIVIGRDSELNYTTLERELILTEISSRVDSPLLEGSVNNEYVYDKLSVISQYIKLIDDINSDNSDRDATSSGIVPSSSITLDQLLDPTTDLEGNTYMDNVVADTAKMLRNVCMDISHSREYLKMIAQKHVRTGTGSIVSEVVKEYIYRNFTPNSIWSKHTFETDTDRIAIDDLNISDAADVSLVEYYDKTNYLNIREPDESTDSTSNLRFWEGDNYDAAVNLSEHTLTDVIEFYENLGWGSDITSINESLSAIYDVHAIRSYIDPTTATVQSIPPTGTFGTQGSWTYNDVTTQLIVQLDEPDEFGYSTTSAYADWIASGILDDFTEAELLTAWLETPDVDVWKSDPYVINGYDLTQTPAAQAWINANYSTTTFDQTDSIGNWLVSPIINNQLTLNEFEAEWETIFFQEPSAIGWFTSVDRFAENYNDMQSNVIIDTYLYGDEFDTQPIPQPTGNLGLPPGTIPSVAQWNTSPWIVELNSLPLPLEESENIGVLFDPRSDWKDSPFVAYFEEVPFANGQLNVTEVIIFGKIASIEYLLSIDAIDSIDDFDTDINYFTGESLDPMYSKYSYKSGVHNRLNTNHPTIAPIPFIWNLIEAKSSFENCLSDIGNISWGDVANIQAVYESTVTDGATHNLQDVNTGTFTGYRSEYQESNKTIEGTDELNMNLDRPGPWNSDALKELISGDNAQFIADVLAGTNEFYTHLDLTEAEFEKISRQLDYYEQAIRDLSEFKIYKYAKDSNGNHYTLFKDTNNFSTPGKIWVRKKNHPLSFPLFAYNTGLPLYDDASYVLDTTSGDVHQANISLSSTPNFGLVSNKCYDFSILEDGTIVAYGADCGVDNVQSYNGYLAIITPAIVDLTDDPTTIIEGEQLVMYPNEQSKNEGIAIPLDSKYIGYYVSPDGTRLVLNTVVKADWHANEYLTAGGDVPSMATYISDNEYEFEIESDTINLTTGLVTTLSTIAESKFDEVTFDAADVVSGFFHNNWKLHLSDAKLSIIHEANMSNYELAVELGDGSIEKLDNDSTLENGVYTEGLQSFDFKLTSSLIIPAFSLLTEVKQYIRHGISMYKPIVPEITNMSESTAHLEWDAIGLLTDNTFDLAPFIADLSSTDTCISDIVDNVIELAPMFGDAVLNPNLTLDYTIGSYMPQLDANAITNWRRFKISDANQYVYNAPIDMGNPTWQVNNIDSTIGTDNIIVTDNSSDPFVLLSDRFTTDYLVNTYMSNGSATGVSGVILGVYEDPSELVFDPDKGITHPRVHTLSVIADFSIASPTLKFVYDLGLSTEIIIKTLLQSEIDDVAASEGANPSFATTPGLLTERQFEVQRRGCSINVRFGKGRDRNDLIFYFNLDLNDHNIDWTGIPVQEFSDWNHIGYISIGGNNPTFEVEKDKVYDSVGVSVTDIATGISISSTMINITTNIDQSDPLNDLFSHNITSDDPYFNITSDDSVTNIVAD